MNMASTRGRMVHCQSLAATSEGGSPALVGSSRMGFVATTAPLGFRSQHGTGAAHQWSEVKWMNDVRPDIFKSREAKSRDRLLPKLSFFRCATSVEACWHLFSMVHSFFNFFYHPFLRSECRISVCVGCSETGLFSLDIDCIGGGKGAPKNQKKSTKICFL